MRRFKADKDEPTYWLCCKCGHLFTTTMMFARKRCSECAYWMRHISDEMIEKIRYKMNEGE